MNYRLPTIFATAALLAALTGCAQGPNYQTPAVQLPVEYARPVDVLPPVTQPTTQPNGGVALGKFSTSLSTHPSDTGVMLPPPAATASSSPVDPARWWLALDDPELASLINRAVSDNQNIAIAASRLQQSRLIEGVVFGGGLPALDLSAGAGRGSGTNTARGRVGAPLHAGTNTTGLQEITEVAGFDAAWEVDLFGHLQRSLEAANADTQAAAEFRDDVLVSIIADVARMYVQVRGDQLRLQLALSNLARQERSVHLVTERYHRGLTNELDVVLAQRELSALRAQIAPIEASLDDYRAALAELLGDYPQTLDGEMFNFAPLPEAPPPADLGLPADLLRRRPDIRRRERELAAATARIGIAVADLYPRLALTSGIGFQGQGLGRTPVVNSLVWSIGPALYWPLFDFGRLDSIVQVQQGRTREALLNYKLAILTSVREVQSATANYAAQESRLRELGDAVAQSRRAVRLATQRYERGLTDFLNVLDAQRQLFDLEDQAAVTQIAATTQWIAIYKALGGGWQAYPQPDPPHPPKPAAFAALAHLFGR